MQQQQARLTSLICRLQVPSSGGAAAQGRVQHNSVDQRRPGHSPQGRPPGAHLAVRKCDDALPQYLRPPLTLQAVRLQ